jgi:hypothetical protein
MRDGCHYASFRRLPNYGYRPWLLAYLVCTHIYSSVTQPKLAFLTARMYLASVPRVAL